MKKFYFILFALIILADNCFSLENDIPSYLMEINTGYAIGINLANAAPVELKVVYADSRFGFTFEGGILLSDNTGCHIFIGPSLFLINNSKMRAPVSLGFDIVGINNKNTYFGFGAIASFNYSISKMIYLGINMEIN